MQDKQVKAGIIKQDVLTLFVRSIQVSLKIENKTTQSYTICQQSFNKIDPNVIVRHWINPFTKNKIIRQCKACRQDENVTYNCGEHDFDMMLSSISRIEI